MSPGRAGCGKLKPASRAGNALGAGEWSRKATAGVVGRVGLGFTGAHSWIDSFFGPDHPLLFDEQYRAKPAFLGVQDAFLGRCGGRTFGTLVAGRAVGRVVLPSRE